MSHDRHSPDIEAKDLASNAKLLGADLSRILGNDSTVIDAGANRGQFSEWLLGQVSVRRIYAFEPGSDAFRDLSDLSFRENIISPIQAVVSNSDSEVTFYLTESDVGSSILKPLAGQPSKWLRQVDKQNVLSRRLDTFILENLTGGAIDLLKSDAQGADLEVLSSAGKYLNPKNKKSDTSGIPVH